MSVASYQLAQVGRWGRKLHAVDPADPNGRVLCETHSPSGLNWQVRNAAGGYSDSVIFQTGQVGKPTCAGCLSYT